MIEFETELQARKVILIVEYQACSKHRTSNKSNRPEVATLGATATITIKYTHP